MKEKILIDQKKLKQYIDIFETYTKEEKGMETKTEAITMMNKDHDCSHCEEFVKWVSESNLLKIDYLDYLNQHGIMLRRPNEVKKTIEYANLLLVRAILTYYIRREIMCEGLFECATREGIFLALLKRIDKLQNQS